MPDAPRTYTRADARRHRWRGRRPSAPAPSRPPARECNSAPAPASVRSQRRSFPCARHSPRPARLPGWRASASALRSSALCRAWPAGHRETAGGGAKILLDAAATHVNGTLTSDGDAFLNGDFNSRLFFNFFNLGDISLFFAMLVKQIYML